jgi:hypothetical protein
MEEHAVAIDPAAAMNAVPADRSCSCYQQLFRMIGMNTLLQVNSHPIKVMPFAD